MYQPDIAIVDTDGLCAVVGLVDPDQPRRQLEHVVSERDDDELSLLRAVFDVIGDNGDIPEVQGGIDLVHKVEWGRLEDV